MIQFRPSRDDLSALKMPLGDLLVGEPRETMPKLALLIRRIHPPKVSAVGDIVSRETFAAGIPVNLRILDQRSMRTPISSLPSFSPGRTYHVRNPAGVITGESLDAIKRAMKENHVVILVDGEEDLLTLPCILESPDNALVLYGQPSQGLVVVTVSFALRRRVEPIMERMTREETGQP